MKKDKPVPEAWIMYPCSQPLCKKFICHARLLSWHAEESRWVCDECWPNLPPIGPQKSGSLDDYLASLNKEGKRCGGGEK